MQAGVIRSLSPFSQKHSLPQNLKGIHITIGIDSELSLVGVKIYSFVGNAGSVLSIEIEDGTNDHVVPGKSGKESQELSLTLSPPDPPLEIIQETFRLKMRKTKFVSVF